MKASNSVEGEVVEHLLFDCYPFWTTRLPRELDQEGSERFEELWALHPDRFHGITQPFTRKTIPLPRWQQAYGHDYRYTGNVNRALPIPADPATVSRLGAATVRRPTQRAAS